MSRSRLQRIAIVAAAFLLCGLTALLVNVQTHFINRWYDDAVLDNWNHYLPCEQWPETAEVYRVIEQHQAVVRQIESIAPGFVGVDVDEMTCPGKADIVIWYASHAQRLVIEGILGADRFFGIPYRLRNQ